MKVFISWAGTDSPSHKTALLLHEHLPIFIDGVKPWLSSKNIPPGSTWRNELRIGLDGAEFCVVCLDRRSLNSQWVLFEVGFIANALDDSSICPYLIDLPPKTLEKLKAGPMAPYQAAEADEMGTLALLIAIARKKRGEDHAHEETVKRRFYNFWNHGLADQFKAARADVVPAPAPRPPRVVRPIVELVGAAPAAALSGQPGATESVARQQGIAPAGPGKSFRLALFNTSFHPRKGNVAHDWASIFEATGIPPEEVVVRDSEGNELPSQVDYFEQSDPTRSALVFSLLSDIQEVPEDYSTPSSYVTIEQGKRGPSSSQPQLQVEDEGVRAKRVRLSNNVLELWLELQPKPWADEADEEKHDWYAGAATTVLLDRRDALDAFRDMLSMEDREKRCMQLDLLRLLFHGRELPHDDFNLINNWYQLISKSSGPVRSVVTVASQPFGYSLAGQNSPGEFWHKCRLYRTISLYRGANYVTEELRVYGTHSAGHAGNGFTVIDFNTRYFSYMDMGLVPVINMSGQNPKWFAINTGWAPYQGYGFATSANLSRVENPEPSYPKKGLEHKSFQWELRDCREATCLHLFTRDAPKELETGVRRVWHEVIDRPLVAKIDS